MTNEYPADLAPILEAITGRAARSCESQDARIFLVDGDSLRYVAGFGESPFPIDPLRPLTRGLTTGRAVIDRTVVHVEDLAAAEKEFPEGNRYQQRSGYRTALAVPLMREGKALGVILLRRSEVRPFDSKHIELAKAFADRATVAIENLRLATELKARNAELTEALEQQTATAEILKVISRSPTEIQPVLNAVAESAARLCEANDVLIRRVDGDLLRLVAHIGPVPVSPENIAPSISRRSIGGCVIRECRTIHVHDVLEPHVRMEYPEGMFLQHQGAPYRSMLIVPLVREDTAIGTIAVRRPEVRPFSEKQIKLLETFAAQAVIAIENVRLFNEIQENGRQLEITNQQLRQARRSLEEQNARLRAEIEAHNRAKGTIECLVDEIRSSHDFGEILGEAPALLQVLDLVGRVAATDSTVLIQGETGTGKELIARAIHGRSQRRERPLIKINCAALPRDLVESELFGHEKGAFTGATQQRQGRFELADGGTIFLDEVSELPLETQPKLLRVLQEQEFERVGGTKTLRTDVRLIAATNRDLQNQVGGGAFRSDLYYRLNVFPLALPPLRERREDIPRLMRHFLSRAARKLGKPLVDVSPAMLEQAMAYEWPGNVRELENFVERSAILARSTVLEAAGPLATQASQGAVKPATAQPSPKTLEDVLVDVERSHILRVLEQTRWAIEGERGAARILGLNPSTLRGRLRKLGLRKNS